MEVDLKNDGNGMSNVEILKHAKQLELPNFRYIMRNEFGKEMPQNIECGIVNLDDKYNPGTHHCAWFKNGDNKIYFDSFGIQPPKEIIRYLKSSILYNTYQIQQYNETNCSEWCLYVLNELNKGRDFISIILDILNDG
jgi:hypothetical protein